MTWLAVGEVVALGLLAVFAGSPVTTALFRHVDRHPHPDARAPEAAERVVEAGAILRGGHWIGLLERTAVYASILVQWPTGIGLVVAVKGLGRYSELRSATPGTAERFIIGTFTSILFASALALTAQWLLHLIPP